MRVDSSGIYFTKEDLSELQRLRSEKKRLLEDAKRLAGTIFSEEEDGVVIDPSVGCPYCPNGATIHLPSCPIALHCQLMAELGEA